MNPDTLHRYSAYRAACKQWGVALAVGIVLVGALGRLEVASLLYAALPLLLLGLVDAAYAGQERRGLELLKGRKVSDEPAGLLPPEGAGASLARTTHAALSLAVWPFYLALGGIVVASSGVVWPGHRQVAGPAVVRAVSAKSAGCGSGGCGTAGGCGSGGCGAGAGKSCSCSGGAARVAAAPKAAPPAPRPVQPYLQTAQGPRALTADPRRARPAQAPAVRAPLQPRPARPAAPAMPPGQPSAQPAPLEAARPGLPVPANPPRGE